MIIFFSWYRKENQPLVWCALRMIALFGSFTTPFQFMLWQTLKGVVALIYNSNEMNPNLCGCCNPEPTARCSHQSRRERSRKADKIKVGKQTQDEGSTESILNNTFLWRIFLWISNSLQVTESYNNGFISSFKSSVYWQYTVKPGTQKDHTV